MSLVEKLAYWFDGQTNHSALHKIRRVEHDFMFKSGIRRVLVFGSDGWYIGNEGLIMKNTICVPICSPRSRTLSEFTYHELGHAIQNHFNLSGWLDPFCRKWCSGSEYNYRTSRARRWSRRIGFVSGYARVSRDEDFCETLAAYLTNRNSWRKDIYFAGERLSSKEEPTLMHKLSAVHTLLLNLKNFR